MGNNLTQENIEEIFKTHFKDDESKETKKYNNFVLKKEILDETTIEKNSKYNFLYPSLDDKNFNIKIAEKKEFNDTQYDGNIYNVEEHAQKMCEAEMELSPHQLFVKNFLSFQTPYNSLLLYHGLGTGKTCSAIGVCEEMRDYLKQLGIVQRIIIVASPNVQENFKLQLFDDRKLKEINGLWNIKSCTGNKYLREINPMAMKGLSKEKVILQINRLINNSYIFMGYIEFANYITKKSNTNETDPILAKKKMIKNLKMHFNNRFIVIDEVHNIRVTEDNDNKRAAIELFKLVKYVDNLRLLLLSATPMYNTYKEIIWLLNLMNMNDKRATIEEKEIFNKDGNLLIDKDGNKIGEELLRRKATGYISFIRGDNPYTFPFRIYPIMFFPEKSLKNITYPRSQLNGKPIIQGIEKLDLYVIKLDSYQNKIYNYIISKTKTKYEGKINFENQDRFGYTILQRPLEALNISYPIHGDIDEVKDVKFLVGTNGLKSVMKYTEKVTPPTKKNFEYKTDKFGDIFSPSEIGKYSSKIKNICDNIKNSNGIVLVYSQYIDGGVVPLALALESIGITRHGTKSPSLFKKAPTDSIDAISMKPKSEHTGEFNPATYTIISGDISISPDNLYEIKSITNESNKDGKNVKVVIISKAGAEGLDLSNIRQVHIMDPWYNLNLIEQIIGRAVRNKSHCKLPFAKRNVEIYLYSSLLDNDNEAVDMYIYRIAEMKAIKIGIISKLIKESAVDCLLNDKQNNFTVGNIKQTVKIDLSSKKTIEFDIGDKPFSSNCDYMESCYFKCNPYKEITNINDTTYNENFILINTDKIIQRIRDLFKNKYFNKKDDLIMHINIVKTYPLVQIYSALSQLINDKNEYLFDQYGRVGNLINIDDYYLFQPLELNDNTVSIYDRENPIYYKREYVSIPVNQTFEDKENIVISIKEDDKKNNLTRTTNTMNNNNIIKILTDKYDLAFKKQTIPRGEKNWYIYCSKVIEDLQKENMDIEILKKMIINHLLELLNYNETLDVVNYLFFNTLNEFEKELKKYYDKYLLINDDLIGLLLINKNSQELLIKTENKWIIGKPEDYIDLKEQLKALIYSKTNINNIVGFYSYFKDEYLIFKVKFMTEKRSKGARCDQSGKNETLKTLNKILDTNKYTLDNTKGRNQIEFCVLQELTLRYYNHINKNNNTWFFTPIEALINNIEKITL